MRLQLLLLILMFGCFSLVPAHVLAQPTAEVRAVLMEQQAAWNRGDIVGFMDGYWRSDSLVFVGKRGPTYGWQQTLANYQRSYPDKAAMGQLTFDLKEFRVLAPDLVFVLGRWTLTRDNDAPTGHFTLLVRRINGAWKVVADHSS